MLLSEIGRERLLEGTKARRRKSERRRDGGQPELVGPSFDSPASSSRYPHERNTRLEIWRAFQSALDVFEQQQAVEKRLEESPSPQPISPLQTQADALSFSLLLLSQIAN